MRGLQIVPKATASIESKAVSLLRPRRIRKRNLCVSQKRTQYRGWNDNERGLGLTTTTTRWNNQVLGWQQNSWRLFSSTDNGDHAKHNDMKGKEALINGYEESYVSDDEEEGEAHQQLMHEQRLIEEYTPQHAQTSMNDDLEASISKFLTLPDVYSISEEEAKKIKECLRFLEHRVKRRKTSEDDVERGFHDAASLEKLLRILLNNTIASKNNSDSEEVNVTLFDFNRALTAWRYAKMSLRPTEPTPSGGKRDFRVLYIQRRNACRCLYACERAQNLLETMEDLAMNGHSNLRPSQYSYESVLGSWSKASGALNYMLRGEGKALASLKKLPPRSDILSSKEQAILTPWYDPAILDGYGLMDPAKRADELLQRLQTMEELDGSEFTVNPWVLKQTLIAWVQVKARPRRFSSQADVQSSEFLAELKIPERVEELLWRIVEMSIEYESQGREFILTPGLFRATISSWSHSNHQEGQYHAEAVLTKMGELYESEKISIMPSPAIFNAVVGSWSRRSPLLPFEAPERCVAIVKHMEAISDGKTLSENEEYSSENTTQKWSKFWPDEKTYRITMGAFKSALYCKKLSTSEEYFKIAFSADEFLKHMLKRYNIGREQVAPDGAAFTNVATCYGKAINVLSSEMEREDEVLQEAGLAFIGVHDNGSNDQLSTALQRLDSLLEEMEAGYDLHPIESNLSIHAYTEVLRAFTSSVAFQEYGEKAVQILKRLITLYEDDHDNISPTSEIFAMVIDALLKNSSVNKFHEASELLKLQEQLYNEGNPSCKPTIKLYRSMLDACTHDPEEAASLLKRMTFLYESNVVDELSDQRGNTSLSFNEILELWSEVDEHSDAASWAESMLLKVANNVEQTSTRCSGSTSILRTKNFDAVIKAWIEAGEIHRAEKLLEEMERLSKHRLLLDLKPGHLSFHSVIKGWIDNDLSQAAGRAEELMKRLSDSGFAPNMVTYQLVFEALIKSSKGRRRGIERAEDLLKKIDETSQTDKNKPLRPNRMLANMILQGWAQSRVDDKGLRAHSLLRWMVNQNEQKEHNNFIKPNFKSYTLVMLACVRTTRHLNTAEKRKCFEITMRTFEDLAKYDNGLKPGSISYRIMLTACSCLLPPGKEQQHHIGAIFDHCSRVGVVDKLIYSAFMETADKDTFALKVGRDKPTWQDLPVEWRKNSKDYKDLQ